jgi:hypothetical protein
MAYKAQFRPCELLVDGHWTEALSGQEGNLDGGV